MSIKVVLGRLADGHDLTMDWADPWHWAVQGQSRSGKSVLTYAALAPIASRSDVVVTGVDPTGILLGPWGSHPCPVMRACGSDDMARASEALANVCTEMDRRIAVLVETGKDKFSDFTEELPLLIVVLEEYPGTLSLAASEDVAKARKPAERVEPQIQRSFTRLVQEGAKVGIRVLLVAQRMDASLVSGAARSNLGTRFTMRVDNADAVRMLHPSASPDDVASVLASAPGLGVVEMPGVGLLKFKADFLSYELYAEAVQVGGLPVPNDGAGLVPGPVILSVRPDRGRFRLAEWSRSRKLFLFLKQVFGVVTRSGAGSASGLELRLDGAHGDTHRSRIPEVQRRRASHHE